MIQLMACDKIAKTWEKLKKSAPLDPVADLRWDIQWIELYVQACLGSDNGLEKTKIYMQQKKEMQDFLKTRIAGYPTEHIESIYRTALENFFLQSQIMKSQGAKREAQDAAELAIYQTYVPKAFWNAKKEPAALTKWQTDLQNQALSHVASFYQAQEKSQWKVKEISNPLINMRKKWISASKKTEKEKNSIVFQTLQELVSEKKMADPDQSIYLMIIEQLSGWDGKKPADLFLKTDLLLYMLATCNQKEWAKIIADAEKSEKNPINKLLSELFEKKDVYAYMIHWIKNNGLDYQASYTAIRRLEKLNENLGVDGDVFANVVVPQWSKVMCYETFEIPGSEIDQKMAELREKGFDQVDYAALEEMAHQKISGARIQEQWDQQAAQHAAAIIGVFEFQDPSGALRLPDPEGMDLDIAQSYFHDLISSFLNETMEANGIWFLTEIIKNLDSRTLFHLLSNEKTNPFTMLNRKFTQLEMDKKREEDSPESMRKMIAHIAHKKWKEPEEDLEKKQIEWIKSAFSESALTISQLSTLCEIEQEKGTQEWFAFVGIQSQKQSNLLNQDTIPETVKKSVFMSYFLTDFLGYERKPPREKTPGDLVMHKEFENLFSDEKTIQDFFQEFRKNFVSHTDDMLYTEKRWILSVCQKSGWIFPESAEKNPIDFGDIDAEKFIQYMELSYWLFHVDCEKIHPVVALEKISDILKKEDHMPGNEKKIATRMQKQIAKMRKTNPRSPSDDKMYHHALQILSAGDAPDNGLKAESAFRNLPFWMRSWAMESHSEPEIQSWFEESPQTIQAYVKNYFKESANYTLGKMVLEEKIFEFIDDHIVRLGSVLKKEKNIPSYQTLEDLRVVFEMMHDHVQIQNPELYLHTLEAFKKIIDGIVFNPHIAIAKRIDIIQSFQYVFPVNMQYDLHDQKVQYHLIAGADKKTIDLENFLENMIFLKKYDGDQQLHLNILDNQQLFVSAIRLTRAYHALQEAKFPDPEKKLEKIEQDLNKLLGKKSQTYATTRETKKGIIINILYIFSSAYHAAIKSFSALKNNILIGRELKACQAELRQIIGVFELQDFTPKNNPVRPLEKNNPEETRRPRFPAG